MICSFRSVNTYSLTVILGAVAQATASHAANRGSPEFREVRRIAAAEAVQGVAVDAVAFYAIANRAIGKYDKHTGQLLKRWEATADVPLEHLNAGIVVDGKLYCAHSNFPRYPAASSIEIWDAQTLEHVDTHSLGICEGSLTWIDWHDGAWWAMFANYSEKVNDDPWARDSRWTSLVQFDAQWRRLAAWALPPQVIDRLQPHSSSGGGWGRGNSLYVTGHDRGEIYQLELPRGGPTLKFAGAISAPIKGQAIAWDHDEPGTFYGIDRRQRQIVVMKLTP
jgi:hypothetical protein